MRVTKETPDQPDVIALIAELDAFQDTLYPAEARYALDLDSLKEPNVVFAVARDLSGRAIGCGAVVFSGERGELKRMYVRPESRGQGVAQQVLRELERSAGQPRVQRTSSGNRAVPARSLGLLQQARLCAQGPVRRLSRPSAQCLHGQSPVASAHWGLTPRSKGAPTARHQAPATGTLYILRGRGLASRRRRPLTSNVRRRMYTCPACHQDGIRVLAKWWSWPSAPASCVKCKAIFTAPVHESGTLTVVTALATTAGGFASVALGSALPIAAAIFLSVCAFIYKWHTQALLSLTPEQVARWRRSDAVGLLAITCSSFFQ